MDVQHSQAQLTCKPPSWSIQVHLPCVQVTTPQQGHIQVASECLWYSTDADVGRIVLASGGIAFCDEPEEHPYVRVGEKTGESNVRLRPPVVCLFCTCQHTYEFPFACQSRILCVGGVYLGTTLQHWGVADCQL